MNTQIKLVGENSRIYNAADHPNHLRGTKLINGKLVKNSCALIYSVYLIDSDGIAHCQSWDCWGSLIEEKILVKHLIPYEKCNS